MLLFKSSGCVIICPFQKISKFSFWSQEAENLLASDDFWLQMHTPTSYKHFYAPTLVKVCNYAKAVTISHIHTRIFTDNQTHSLAPGHKSVHTDSLKIIFTVISHFSRPFLCFQEFLFWKIVPSCMDNIQEWVINIGVRTVP